MERFSRTELLLGKEKLKRIRNSHVTIFGLGAVGSYATEALARAGIGNMRVVDFDTIKPTNINRHLYALTSTLGETKVGVAARRVRDINPSCNIEPLEIFADENSIIRVLKDHSDMVIDAIDSLNPKVQLILACSRRKIPIVSSMGAALRTDPFSIKTGDLFQTRGCPLAQRIRKRLRKEGVKEGVFCVYSDGPRSHSVCEEDGSIEEGEYERGRKRKKMGSMPTITGIFGLVVAHCALDILLEKKL